VEEPFQTDNFPKKVVYPVKPFVTVAKLSDLRILSHFSVDMGPEKSYHQ
jgi:hypothetical protein